MNINIYSKYKATLLINTSYKSYDSDAEDYWKEDKYINDLELDGGSLINKIVKSLDSKYFLDVDIIEFPEGTLRIKIRTFDPTHGDGDEIIYIIRELKKEEK